MKNLSIPLVLFAAASAAPMLAQDALPPAAKPVPFVCDADLDVAVALVSLDDRCVPALGHWLLASAVAIPMVAVDGTLLGKLPLPADWDLVLHWQVLGIRPSGELLVGDVSKFDPTDKAKPRVLSLQPKPVSADALAKKGPVSPPDLPLTLAPIRDDAGTMVAVYAAFVAPTDGYSLALIDVRAADSDGSAAIYLYRKLPAKGEGHKRVEKKHAVTAKLPPGQKHAQVFLAEGTTDRPLGPIAYRRIGRLP